MHPTRIIVTLAALVTLVVTAGSRAQSLCPGDATNDSQVNSVDIAQVLADWGACSSCLGDVNDDGQVNASDLAEVLAGWGPCRPVILEITPSSGVASGGTLVTISGAYFNSVSSVEFGGVLGTGLTVLNSSTLTVVTPPGAAGSTAVRVTTSAGNAVRKGGFSYLSIIVPSWATLIEAIPDPAVVMNEGLRSAILATGFAWRVRDNASQIEMLLVPPGTFEMGCSGSDETPCFHPEVPIHPVTLTGAFYLGRYEVTQAQWTAAMGSNPSNFQGDEYPNWQIRPVERVSWNMIQDFNAATGLRLPTEAEWEYAYRASTTTAYHSFPGHPDGTNSELLAGSIAWHFNTSAGRTRLVGQKFANGFGLHDMSGNVWEWVNDWYSDIYYQTSPTTNPPGPLFSDLKMRVIRGGAWDEVEYGIRSSRRGATYPSFVSYNCGFRVARNP
jgi:formylglycine-generating enzyme required for sulfatase activity